MADASQDERGPRTPGTGGSQVLKLPGVCVLDKCVLLVPVHSDILLQIKFYKNADLGFTFSLLF